MAQYKTAVTPLLTHWSNRLLHLSLPILSHPPVAPLIQAWICNHMPSKVWDEITYPFLNFNGATVEV